MTCQVGAGEVLGALRRTPCLVTLAGGVAGVAGALALAAGDDGLAVLLLLLGQLLDIADGALARRLRLVSQIGATMDLFVDVALTHVLLTVWGLLFLVPIVATLQALAHVLRIKASGRTLIVCLTIAAVLWDMLGGA